MFYSRKSPRIQNFDYSSENYYFVTICTHDKACIFGKPRELNTFGNIALDELKIIPKNFPNVILRYYVVMPNHIHAIIEMSTNSNLGLSEIIGLYKSGVSRKIHQIDPNVVVWQRSFHDHVIRNDSGYAKIAEYILTNPDRWGEDCFYCKI